MCVRKEQDYYGKQTNDEETMEKQAILFPARVRKASCGNVFELCNTLREEQTKIVCCTVNKWTILKGLTIEVHNIYLIAAKRNWKHIMNQNCSTR